MDNFVEQVRLRMTKLGINRAQLAEGSGISRAYIYRVLDGKQVPSMDVADKIATSVGLVITTAPAR
jgi:transcriptional regulator with XRE-family HTH domain